MPSNLYLVCLQAATVSSPCTTLFHTLPPISAHFHTLPLPAGGYDILSRFFAPWMGIPEDHVTGSAHAVLAPFWQARLSTPPCDGVAAGVAVGVLKARQCSPRGGDMTVRVEAESGRVVVSGEAVIVIKGTMHIA